jgi:hypothetical protein
MPHDRHLVDGTYELFRHFYGLRRFNKGKDRPYGRWSGAADGAADAREGRDAHRRGNRSRHRVVRNDLWNDYKTGEGIEPALYAQFHPLESALAAMGVVVWPMVELEADDALASAAEIASEDERVEKVCIWTVDKDLAQCVRGDRVVQMDRRAKKIFDAQGVRQKFGVEPDAHPGFPRARRRSPPTAIPAFRDRSRRQPRACSIGMVRSRRSRRKRSARARPGAPVQALATLKTDAPLFRDVDELRWNGPADRFAAWATRMDAPRLVERSLAAIKRAESLAR